MSNSPATMDSFGDIHENLRYWMELLARMLRAERGRPLVVFDIGSNDGELTLPLARHGDTVVAFEPQPAARSRLAERARGLALHILPFALGAEPESASLHTFSDDSFSSLYARPADQLEHYHLRPAATITVEVETLDRLREGVLADVRPDLVKIDVEGGEAAVLRGARATLGEAMPAVVVEYSCLNAGNAGAEREEIRLQLEAIGYRHVFGLWRNSDRRLHGGATLNDCRIWNLIAVDPAHAATVLPYTTTEERG